MAKTTPPHQRRGREAEDAACAHLRQNGLTLLARNYRSPWGEIDLVMQDGDGLVFVEVRYRARTDFGAPAETVDGGKQSRLRATAEHYLQHTRGASRKPCRFDIVAIAGGADGGLHWLRNAF
ncbi:MAG: YraN family protein [Pseudomonadota bacterium]